MNIEKIIKNNKIEKEYQIVKEMEDMIQNIYKNNVDTDIFDDEKLLLYRINENNNINIKLYKNPNELLSKIELPNFLNEIYSDLIFYGSYVRTALIEVDKVNDKVNDNTNLELFIASYKLIDNLDDKFTSNGFEKSETGFYKKNSDIIIHFISNRFKSIGEVLLFNPYLTRFGIHNNEFIVSSMFIIEYNRNLKHINKKKLDPKFSTEIDLFHLKKKLEKKPDTIFDLIMKKDFASFSNLLGFKLDETKDGLTPIEFAIKLYKLEECDIISYQLKLIIFELFDKIKFVRNPGFYAIMIRLYEKDATMYEILIGKIDKSIDINEISEISDNDDKKIGVNGDINILKINYYLLQHYISNDDYDAFYSYLKLYVKKIDSKLIQLIYEKNPKKIITEGIKKKYFSLSNIYKLILYTQDLEYFDLIDFDMNIACNYLEDIIKKGLIRSFYFLFKQDKMIIQFKDSDGNTILHTIQDEGLYEDMIKLIITLDPSILFIKNDNGETPILYNAKQKKLKIVESIIKNYSNTDLFEQINNDGDTFLHLLSNNNENIKLIKMFIYDNLYLIDKVNMTNETPILIACKFGCEDIYFLLKSLNADLSILDYYGNSVYHYICLNSIIIGSVIENKPNIFGYTPEDYCDISPNYYAFV